MARLAPLHGSPPLNPSWPRSHGSVNLFLGPNTGAEKGSTASISQRNLSFLVCFLMRLRSQLLNPNCCSFTSILPIPIHTRSNHSPTAGGRQGSLWGSPGGASSWVPSSQNCLGTCEQARVVRHQAPASPVSTGLPKSSQGLKGTCSEAPLCKGSWADQRPVFAA